MHTNTEFGDFDVQRLIPLPPLTFDVHAHVLRSILGHTTKPRSSGYFKHQLDLYRSFECFSICVLQQHTAAISLDVASTFLNLRNHPEIWYVKRCELHLRHSITSFSNDLFIVIHLVRTIF